MKKKMIISCIGIILIFAAFNVFWYFTTHNLYSKYAEGMEKMETFTYCKYDEDHFGYAVSFPSYLHFNTGCLSVTESESNSTLIIWPQYNQNPFEFGLILNYKEEGYHINVTDKGKAINPHEQEIIDSNQEIVNQLYEKAKQQWGKYLWK